MRSWHDAAPGLPRNRFALLSFHDQDHGAGGPNALAWIEELLEREQVEGVDGEIWLHTYPRVLGYAFKPVSFWYCHRRDGSLRAVVAEVNNTFGERHCYVLDGPDVAYGRTLHARKVFHVSPFCSVTGSYVFRFMRTHDRLVARVEHHDRDGPLLITSLSGNLQPLSRQAGLGAVIRRPWMTLAVMARIHWHAAKLWLKKVPFHRKPEPPPMVSR
jgi:uncharacterized protein